jgi:hypothetical protein
MGCPIVRPERVRIQLVDVQRRILQELLQRKKPAASKTAIRIAEAAVAKSEADGDWIDVKKELNAGEYQELISSQFIPGPAGEEPRVDKTLLGFSKLTAYIIGWSYTELDGTTPLPIGTDTFRAMSFAGYQLLVRAVDDHYAAVEDTLEQKKKFPSDEMPSSETLESVA